MFGVNPILLAAFACVAMANCTLALSFVSICFRFFCVSNSYLRIGVQTTGVNGEVCEFDNRGSSESLR
jgi:hypothetical protein